MSQIYEFSTTYQLSYQERLPISKASKERSGTWSKSIPFVAKIEMANARILVQQFTRLVQYLLSPFVPASVVFAGKTGNIHNRK